MLSAYGDGGPRGGEGGSEVVLMPIPKISEGFLAGWHTLQNLTGSACQYNVLPRWPIMHAPIAHGDMVSSWRYGRVICSSQNLLRSEIETCGITSSSTDAPSSLPQTVSRLYELGYSSIHDQLL